MVVFFAVECFCSRVSVSRSLTIPWKDFGREKEDCKELDA